MKKALVLVLIALAVLISGIPAVLAGGINNPPGVPLYVIIEVDWDGVSPKGDWAVWGPVWEPEVGGTLLTSCTDCLDANYTFTFRGKTVHFDEVGVSTVVYTPQVRHVVLHDLDGDGTYTGSLSASHYFPWRPNPEAILYFDRIDYTITFDEDGNVTYFHYLQYEHKKLK